MPDPAALTRGRWGEWNRWWYVWNVQRGTYILVNSNICRVKCLQGKISQYTPCCPIICQSYHSISSLLHVNTKKHIPTERWILLKSIHSWKGWENDLDSKQYKENLIITPLARISIDWIGIIVCNAYYALHPIFYALHRREKERWSIPGLSRKGLIMMRVLMEKGFSNLTQG